MVLVGLAHGFAVATRDRWGAAVSGQAALAAPDDELALIAREAAVRTRGFGLVPDRDATPDEIRLLQCVGQRWLLPPVAKDSDDRIVLERGPAAPQPVGAPAGPGTLIALVAVEVRALIRSVAEFVLNFGSLLALDRMQPSR